jgi:hypothetical protein
MKDGAVMDFRDAGPIPSWPNERSRLQATAELTRDVARGNGPALPGGPPWQEDEARDLFTDIARKGRMAKVSSAEDA